MVRRWTHTLAAAVTMVVLTAVPALGHVLVRPGEAPASSRQTLTFDAAHGCDDEGLILVQVSPMIRVTIEMGSEVSDVVPVDPGGWEPAVETRDDGTIFVSWDKLDGGPEEVPLFEVGMTLPATEGDLYFPVVQDCEQGDEVAWVEIPAEGQHPDELEWPAPSILLTAADDVSTPAAPTTTVAETATTTAALSTTVVAVAGEEEDGDGGSAWPWVLGGVAVVAAVGGGIWFARRDITGGA